MYSYVMETQYLHTSTEVQTWQETYIAFLNDRIRNSEVDFDVLADGSGEQMWIHAFIAAGYPVTPFFYIYDIDDDGVPELIYVDATIGCFGEIYAYNNNSIEKIGSIKFYPFGGFGTPLDKKEGLYSNVGYKGHNGELYFYCIENGVLREEMVLQYNNQSDVSTQQPGLPYLFDNFTYVNYYELTEENIEFLNSH